MPVLDIVTAQLAVIENIREPAAAFKTMVAKRDRAIKLLTKRDRWVIKVLATTLANIAKM